MKRFFRLTIALILPLLALLAGLFATVPARAQSPDDWHLLNGGSPSWDWDISPESGDVCTLGFEDFCGTIRLKDAYQYDSYLNFFLPADASAIRVNASKTLNGGIDVGITNCAHIGNAPMDWQEGSWTWTVSCTEVLTAGWHTMYWANNSTGSDTYIFNITLEYYGAAPDEPTEGGDTCPLIQDSHFESPDPPLWSLYGTAAITASNLILSPGDFVAQNLTDTLESGLAYTVIVSVSQVIAPGPLDVSLGTVSATLQIAEPGRYTTSLTAPSAAGPVMYALENTGYGDLYLDYTCLSTGEGETVCLAPENGTFDTANGWLWYRNAFWEQAGQMAALPYNQGSDGDMALVQAGRAYSMPTVPTGQYLILGYQAQASDEVGLISSKVGTAEAEQKVYKAPYDYEIDISTQAGQSVDLAFADSGTSDVLLDNVCVFLSPDPPQLPQPTDPGGIAGVDFGFNYTCTDVPALLAGWGINVYGAQAIFDAGVSIWEPQYYIPWLSAALWANAGRPISCFIVEHMRLLAGVTQQQINEFLNFVNWSVRSANATAPWLQSGFSYLNKTVFSPATAARTTAAGWLPWWSNSLRSILKSVGDNWKITTDWIKEAALYVGKSAGGSSQDFADNLPGVGTGWGLLDLVWSLADLVWWLWNWIFTNIILLADVPIRFYYAFNDGVSGQAFGSLMSCANYNFWCGLLAGTQLVNQTIGHSILYPIVIVGIILTTFAILWKHFWSLVSFEIR